MGCALRVSFDTKLWSKECAHPTRAPPLMVEWSDFCSNRIKKKLLWLLARVSPFRFHATMMSFAVNSIEMSLISSEFLHKCKIGIVRAGLLAKSRRVLCARYHSLSVGSFYNSFDLNLNSHVGISALLPWLSAVRFGVKLPAPNAAWQMRKTYVYMRLCAPNGNRFGVEFPRWQRERFAFDTIFWYFAIEFLGCHLLVTQLLSHFCGNLHCDSDNRAASFIRNSNRRRRRRQMARHDLFFSFTLKAVLSCGLVCTHTHTAQSRAYIPMSDEPKQWMHKRNIVFRSLYEWNGDGMEKKIKKLSVWAQSKHTWEQIVGLAMARKTVAPEECLYVCVRELDEWETDEDTPIR